MAKKTVLKLIEKRHNVHSQLIDINKLEHQITSFNKERSPIYNKAIPKEAINSVFEKLETGELNKYFSNRLQASYTKKRYEPYWEKYGKITSEYNIHVFPLTRSSLGTMRIFNEKSHISQYLQIANKFYSEVNKYQNQFKHFKVQPINVLGVKKLKNGNYALLEKVQPAITVNDLIGKPIPNKYSENHLSFLNRKVRVSSPEFKTTLERALKEYTAKFEDKCNIDCDSKNILVLDYDPISKKVLFGPIDFIGSQSRSF